MLILIREGWRMFKRSIKVKFSGFEKISGTDEEICKKIVDSCWNGKYFSTTPKNGHYGFYCRDFGWCTQSLINLGYKKEVNSTLDYALSIFEKNNAIYVSINPSGEPFNFPSTYSPDSIAYIFRSVRINGNKKLIEKYSKFLNSEAKKFKEICIDDSGMIKKIHFSGMRDYAIIKGACYDMIMACMLDDEINKINHLMKNSIIDNPFKKFDLKKVLIKNFWNKEGFYDYNDSVYGHNNVYPYLLDIIKDHKIIQSSLKTIKNANLENPIPLKYESNKKHTKFIWQEIFVKGWEKHASWTMLGMAYIEVLSKIDKKSAKLHIKQYKKLIEQYGFVEVYDGLTPYQSVFYASETRMLWAAMYLDLKKRLK
ncbi:MAG: hypothetical protein ACP5NV_01350 [Candidatus Woesearchaeota archaeon]